MGGGGNTGKSWACNRHPSLFYHSMSCSFIPRRIVRFVPNPGSPRQRLAVLITPRRQRHTIQANGDNKRFHLNHWKQIWCIHNFTQTYMYKTSYFFTDHLIFFIILTLIFLLSFFSSFPNGELISSLLDEKTNLNQETKSKLANPTSMTNHRHEYFIILPLILVFIFIIPNALIYT